MTRSAQTLATLFGTIDFLVPLVLDDLTEEQARARSRDRQGPSIAWSLGHLLHFRNDALALLGAPKEDAYGERFASTAATDGEGYPTLDTLRGDWDRAAAALAAALEKATEDSLDAQATGPHDVKTVRDRLAFLAFHEGYHLGAIGALRKALGLPGPAELAMAGQAERR